MLQGSNDLVNIQGVFIQSTIGYANSQIGWKQYSYPKEESSPPFLLQLLISTAVRNANERTQPDLVDHSWERSPWINLLSETMKKKRLVFTICCTSCQSFLNVQPAYTHTHTHTDFLHPSSRGCERTFSVLLGICVWSDCKVRCVLYLCSQFQKMVIGKIMNEKGNLDLAKQIEHLDCSLNCGPVWVPVSLSFVLIHVPLSSSTPFYS